MSEGTGAAQGFDTGATEMFTEIRDLLREVKNRMR